MNRHHVGCQHVKTPMEAMQSLIAQGALDSSGQVTLHGTQILAREAFEDGIRITAWWNRLHTESQLMTLRGSIQIALLPLGITLHKSEYSVIK